MRALAVGGRPGERGAHRRRREPQIAAALVRALVAVGRRPGSIDPAASGRSFPAGGDGSRRRS